MEKDQSEDDINHTKEEFQSSENLEELMKMSYETELSRKENLDEKATWMMEIASIVASLYGGFGLVTSTSLFSENVQLSYSTLVLIIGVSLLISSIFVAAKAFFVRTYHYATNYKKFVSLQSDKKVNFDEKEINEFRKKETLDLSFTMIKSYLSCIVRNHEYNEEKAKDLIVSQVIFFAGLVTVPLFIIVTALNF